MLKGVSQESALRFAHRVSRTIGEQPILVDGDPMNVKVYFGVASAEASFETRPQALIDSANRRLERARRGIVPESPPAKPTPAPGRSGNPTGT
jgi:GGDEF domain-containing protein